VNRAILVIVLMAHGTLGACTGDGAEGSSSSSGGAVTAPEGFVTIAPGTFTMGSPAGEVGRMSQSYSQPEDQHAVTIPHGFWMQAKEVTEAQWKRVTQRPLQGDPVCDDCPVTSVSALDAVAYCNLLSTQQGLPPCYDTATGEVVDGTTVTGCTGYRLPTEEEWEYAARAGTTTATYAGDLTAPGNDDTTLLPIAWFAANSGETAHAVGQRAPNAWGLHDMLGNAREWVDDVPAEGRTYRFLRGGSWWDDAAETRAATRSFKLANNRQSHVGFRTVRTVK
jgi:formylglycine-generating enzyme required for sulfatase activity